ncbi:MAG: hypothetical protein KAS93_03305 [Gammaproteobacteria bacterium]|nr:hypothetical protein [Gammaproteobacteria bacterium]
MEFFVANHLALLLIFFGILFMIAELFVFSFGVLGIAGFIAFMFGLVIFFDVAQYGFAVALPLIVIVGLAVGAFLFVIIRLGIKAHRKPVVSGREDLVGKVGQVNIAKDGAKTIKFRGEVWQISSQHELFSGQKVRIVRVEDLILYVEPIEELRHD